jgi:hypothetical protein
MQPGFAVHWWVQWTDAKAAARRANTGSPGAVAEAVWHSRGSQSSPM